jgi:hypothetical protein
MPTELTTGDPEKTDENYSWGMSAETSYEQCLFSFF